MDENQISIRCHEALFLAYRIEGNFYTWNTSSPKFIVYHILPNPPHQKKRKKPHKQKNKQTNKKKTTTKKTRKTNHNPQLYGIMYDIYLCILRQQGNSVYSKATWKQ
jgi:hypothetical protein